MLLPKAPEWPDNKPLDQTKYRYSFRLKPAKLENIRIASLNAIDDNHTDLFGVRHVTLRTAIQGGSV